MVSCRSSPLTTLLKHWVFGRCGLTLTSQFRPAALIASPSCTSLDGPEMADCHTWSSGILHMRTGYLNAELWLFTRFCHPIDPGHSQFVSRNQSSNPLFGLFVREGRSRKIIDMEKGFLAMQGLELSVFREGGTTRKFTEIVAVRAWETINLSSWALYSCHMLPSFPSQKGKLKADARCSQFHNATRTTTTTVPMPDSWSYATLHLLSLSSHVLTCCSEAKWRFLHNDSFQGCCRDGEYILRTRQGWRWSSPSNKTTLICHILPSNTQGMLDLQACCTQPIPLTR